MARTYWLLMFFPVLLGCGGAPVEDDLNRPKPYQAPSPYGGLLLTDFASAFEQELIPWEPVRNIEIKYQVGNIERTLPYEFQARHPRTGAPAVTFAVKHKTISVGQYAFVKLLSDVEGFNYAGKAGEEFIYDGANWAPAQYVVRGGETVKTPLVVDARAMMMITGEGELQMQGAPNGKTGPQGWRSAPNSGIHGALIMSVNNVDRVIGTAFTGDPGAAGQVSFKISNGPGNAPGKGQYVVRIKDIR